MKKILGAFLFFITVWACTKDYKTPDEINNIPVNVEVKRFDVDFANSSISNFKQLKKQYPFMPNDNWLNDKKDTLVTEMLSETQRFFPDFNTEVAELELLFKHIKYHYPQEQEPTIVTVTSGVDYRNKVIRHDSLLFISLDTYLGGNHKYYSVLPKYIASNLKKEQLVSDVAEVYAKEKVSKEDLRQFIAQMIYFGKVLYLKDQFLPFKERAERIGYSKEQIEWAKANEAQVWSYFVEQDLLFSTDVKLHNRFLAVAPFSKFYLEIDNESPGMIGRFIGWQIVRSFMKNNDVSLRELCQLKGEDIFRKAKYKPVK